MAYLTRSEAVRAARSTLGHGVLAEAELRKSARSPRETNFDIFLSHAAEDSEVIAGIKALLENEGMSVYVDWLEDPQLDRSRVTARTADMLRARMNHSRYLLYASSHASPKSKWMPWELGYFDGRRPGKIGILPIVAAPGQAFSGLEYLGLYPTIERIDFQNLGRKFGRFTGPDEGDVLKTLARR
ncbi:MAG: toll/interleukin-1 receptor domain-containing protein [Gaiellaceae bacterium]